VLTGLEQRAARAGQLDRTIAKQAKAVRHVQVDLLAVESHEHEVRALWRRFRTACVQRARWCPAISPRRSRSKRPTGRRRWRLDATSVPSVDSKMFDRLAQLEAAVRDRAGDAAKLREKTGLVLDRAVRLVTGAAALSEAIEHRSERRVVGTTRVVRDHVGPHVFRGERLDRGVARIDVGLGPFAAIARGARRCSVGHEQHELPLGWGIGTYRAGRVFGHEARERSEVGVPPDGSVSFSTVKIMLAVLAPTGTTTLPGAHTARSSSSPILSRQQCGSGALKHWLKSLTAQFAFEALGSGNSANPK
jgi:hypothetical protein